MNVVELHDRTDFWVDRTKSARFSAKQRDDALNIAQDDLVKDRYDNIKNVTGYSFQSVQRLRDELRTLIPAPAILTPVNNIITIPSDYRHEIMLRVTINGKERGSEPTDYDEFNTIENNPFEKSEINFPKHLEQGNTIELFFGSFGTFTQARLFYLKQPADILNDVLNVITAGVGVLTIGATYFVNVGPITHNAVTFQTGATFTAVNADFVGPGTVYLIVNSELPVNMHEELAKTAGAILSDTVADRQRTAALNAEADKS